MHFDINMCNFVQNLVLIIYFRMTKIILQTTTVYLVQNVVKGRGQIANIIHFVYNLVN